MLDEELTNLLQGTIEDKLFQKRHKTKPNVFTRTRILSFKLITLIILNKISKSLNVEVNRLLTKLLSPLVSKQAFSKARYHLKASAFIELNDVLLNWHYESNNPVLYKNKYCLLSVDGTDLHLPWTASLVAEFSQMDNGKMKQPMCIAKGIKVWDVLNKLNIATKLYAYEVAEIKMFKDIWTRVLPQMNTMTKAPKILIGDMAYPAFWMFHMLQSQGVEYVFRCKKDFCKEVVAFSHGTNQDSVLDLDMNQRGRKQLLIRQGIQEPIPDIISVRIQRIKKANGEQTYLVSSLDQDQVNSNELKDIYKLRWGHEVSFHFDKNKMEAENFSTKKPQGIRQEWQAGMLAANLGQLMINDAQQILDEQDQQKTKKYKYKINKSVALGLIKDELPMVINGQQTFKEFYDKMIPLILKFKEPIRPNRSYPRVNKHNKKYHMNMRKIY